MSGTFLEKDVTLLLKDITGQIQPLSTSERETLIQSGIHYSEMLPLEYTPSEKYIKTYERALNEFAGITANSIAVAAEKIWNYRRGKVVIVSLARSGTPIGILIKRYLDKKYLTSIPHYSISIIRGKGIDENAIGFILRNHNSADIQFVDGWTGKGAILREMKQALSKYPGLNANLAVVSDPAGLTGLYGTREDFLIASSCLNSTVCGLMSRTVLRNDLIGKDDYHGVVFYNELKSDDRTYEFIDEIEKHFENVMIEATPDHAGPDSQTEVEEIARNFGIKDINFIKPSVGEATRVLLRRVPEVLLVKDYDNKYILHLKILAGEKGVPVEEYPLVNYNACGIIKSVGADV